MASAIALFIVLSLATYHFEDPGWSHAVRGNGVIINAGGTIGAYIADTLYLVFGYCAYLLPFSMVYVAWVLAKDLRIIRPVEQSAIILRTIGFILMITSACALFAFETEALDALHGSGGIIGSAVASRWYHLLNLQGATLLLLAMLLVGITWFTGLSWLNALELIGYYTLLGCKKLGAGLGSLQLMAKARLEEYQTKAPGLPRRQAAEKPMPSLFRSPKEKEPSLTREKSGPVLMPAEKPVEASKPVIEISKPVVKEPKELRESKPQLASGLPGINLLDKGEPGKPMGGFTHQELEHLSREVEQHLLDFGIQADVVAVHPGPVVTRFELQLAAGVKVSKLTALSKDLARSLSVISVRVVEVIPGKTVVGLELPNQSREIVRLSDVLSADVYQQAHSNLTLALGVDIAGHPMVVDLAKMPHLLVAGTTGSGKSVGINAMILSILLKATPEQVRLIMIDPKMLELSVYDGIPHLLTPVVTDMKEAASALRWCVEEMERRYKLMSAMGVRNLAGFNTKIIEAAAAGAPLSDPLWKPTDSMDLEAPLLKELPYVVVVIDELADMMMVVGKKVEQLIARIAQKARAAGIHMILATQRPSVDVLTGLIKSNIPTRISFQVSSKIDSRTILDQQGAEQLLGHGDMLYLAPGSGAPLRVHGAFVDDKEVHRIADDWRARGEPDYVDDILKFTADGEGGSDEEGGQVEDEDPLFDQAVEFVIQTRKASISAVQRRLKIGYNRAARMIEEMERTGIVGPLEGGYRDVLVSSITED